MPRVVLTEVVPGIFLLGTARQQMGISQSSTARGPQVLVLISTYCGSIWGTYF